MTLNDIARTLDNGAGLVYLKFDMTFMVPVMPIHQNRHIRLSEKLIIRPWPCLIFMLKG
jgi:hypothetical protein